MVSARVCQRHCVWVSVNIRTRDSFMVWVRSVRRLGLNTWTCVCVSVCLWVPGNVWVFVGDIIFAPGRWHGRSLRLLHRHKYRPPGRRRGWSVEINLVYQWTGTKVFVVMKILKKPPSSSLVESQRILSLHRCLVFPSLLPSQNAPWNWLLTFGGSRLRQSKREREKKI